MIDQSDILSKRFSNMNDLRNYIAIISGNTSLKEIYSQPHAVMFLCPNYKKFCDAKIIGIYNSITNNFEIKRCELVHRCMLHKRDDIGEYEMERVWRKGMRCGELVEKLIERGLLIDYLQAFELIKKFKGDLDECVNKENCGNIKRRGGHLFDECLRFFEAEFKEMNPGIFTRRGPEEFFFKHSGYHMHFRRPVEIKMYKRECGYLVVGFMFDSNNEPVVYSALLTTRGKEESLLSFVKYNSEEIAYRNGKIGIDRVYRMNRARDSCNGRFVSVKNRGTGEMKMEKKEFYIVDLDMTIINVLESAGVNFFVKTRSVCAYLEDDMNDDKLRYSEYFQNCNYGTVEYLKLKPKFYLAKKCKNPLYGINNLFPADPDYISDILLMQPFFVCLNSLLYLINEDMRNRQVQLSTATDTFLPDWLNEILDDYSTFSKNNPSNNPNLNKSFDRSVNKDDIFDQSINKNDQSINKNDQSINKNNQSINKNNQSIKFVDNKTIDEIVDEVVDNKIIDNLVGIIIDDLVDNKLTNKTSKKSLSNNIDISTNNINTTDKSTTTYSNTYNTLLKELSNFYCECGKFQEYLYPCIHVVKKVIDLGFDPSYFVSSIYLKSKIQNVNYVRPVINVGLDHYILKPLKD